MTPNSNKVTKKAPKSLSSLETHSTEVDGSIITQELDEIIQELLYYPYHMFKDKTNNGFEAKAKFKIQALLTKAELEGIDKFITDGWGKRCKTRDFDDFPEIDEFSRCPTCEMWEHRDEFINGLKQSKEGE